MARDGLRRACPDQVHQIPLVLQQLGSQVRQVRLRPQLQLQRLLADVVAKVVAQHLDHVRYVAMP
eukprot:4584248-Prorocentrum_lima.AAC.1